MSDDTRAPEVGAASSAELATTYSCGHARDPRNPEYHNVVGHLIRQRDEARATVARLDAALGRHAAPREATAMPTDAERCGACGSAVRVVGSDEGTAHDEPIPEPDARELIGLHGRERGDDRTAHDGRRGCWLCGRSHQ